MDAGTYSLYSTPWPKDKAADGGFNRGDRVTFRLRRAGRSTSVLSNCNKKAGDGNARRRTAGANFMELIKFRILNFRSINDSGEITVDRLTSLVGRNESGKSNLLLALATLNPAGGRKPLNKIKDFPRGRRLEECTDDTPVVASRWKLSAAETDAIAKTLGSYGGAITEAEVTRSYGPTPRIRLAVTRPTATKEEIESVLRRLAPVLTARIAALDAPHNANSDAAWKSLEATVDKINDPKAWAAAAAAAVAGLRTRLGEGAITLSEDEDKLLAQLETKAKLVVGFDDAYKAARSQIVTWLPTFIYVAEFPELYGHQNLDQFLSQRGANPRFKEAEDNFEKMAKVAGFIPKQLHDIRDDHETRNQLLNRAGSVVTQEIRRLWKDRPLKVRFHLDGPYLAH